MSADQTTPVILSACRTPIGKYLGGLAPLPAPRLGALVIREAVRRAGIDPAVVDEVIMGNVLQGGVGQAPARQAAIHAGLPGTIPALTVNKVCGSGLKAVMLAAQAIKAGDEECVVAGGVESVSHAPPHVYGLRGGLQGRDTPPPGGGVHQGLWGALPQNHPGHPPPRPPPQAGGGDPQDLFFAPIVAVRNLLAQAKTKISDYDLIEANEAFAVQALADGRALGWDWARVNVNGGAIALGHPIGASGARVLTTLLYALKDKQQTTGLATLCLGGGNAVALSVEML